MARFRFPCPFCPGEMPFQPSREAAVEMLRAHLAECQVGRSDVVELVAAGRALVLAANEQADRAIAEHPRRVSSPKRDSVSANVGRLDAILRAFDWVEV